MTDGTKGAPRFDPRFNPAFQPGYDPGAHAPAPVRRQTPSASPTERVAEPPIRVSAPREEHPVTASAAAASAAPAVEEAVPTVAGRLNPVIVAIWVLSVVFVVGGVYGLRFIDQRVADLSTAGGFGNSDYYLLQAYATGAPMLIVLGLASFTATLFFYAARWRRRA